MREIKLLSLISADRTKQTATRWPRGQDSVSQTSYTGTLPRPRTSGLKPRLTPVSLRLRVTVSGLAALSVYGMYGMWATHQATMKASDEAWKKHLAVSPDSRFATRLH